MRNIELTDEDAGMLLELVTLRWTYLHNIEDEGTNFSDTYDEYQSTERVMKSLQEAKE